MVALLEFQAKDLLRRAGIPVPEGTLVRRGNVTVANLRGESWVCKAQVPAKSRAAVGGIRFAADRSQVLAEVTALLSDDIGGNRAIAVLVEERLPIAQEWFVSVVTDVWGSGLVMQVSDAGGSDVEERLENGHVARLTFAPTSAPDATGLMSLLGWDERDSIRARVAALCAELCQIAIDRDLLLLEINPLAITTDGAAVVVDAHVTVDDAAEFRQQWVTSFDADLGRVHQGWAWRRRYSGDFKIIDERGHVALLNTGAGAGMLAMDELARRGIRAFNFSDIRAGTLFRRRERFDAAADLICAASRVSVVLVNIHAGITDLRSVREDLERVLRRFGSVRVPTVLRLQGPHSVETGTALAGLAGVEVEPHLDKALERTCRLAREAS